MSWAEPAVRFENVRKVFGFGGQSFVALDGIDLDIGRGEIHAVVGRSGAGKSTLIRTINRLTDVSGGRVLVDGQDMSQLSGVRLRRKQRQIGMIFQHFNLYDRRTVRANIAFPLEIQKVARAEIDRRVGEAVKLVDLSERAGHYPAQLSGGQKQRVGIARALVTEPDILLSDEATSALDAETTEQILALLREIRDRLNVTIVMITHEFEIVKRIASHATLLESGRVVDSGSIKDLVLQPESPLGNSLLARSVDDQAILATGPDILNVTFMGDLARRPYFTEIASAFGADITVLSVVSERIGDIWYARFVLRITVESHRSDTEEDVTELVRRRFESLGVRVERS